MWSAPEHIWAISVVTQHTDLVRPHTAPMCIQTAHPQVGFQVLRTWGDVDQVGKR